MSSSQFRAMLAAHRPAPLRDYAAPVEHEEVASSRWMAEALEQLRTGPPPRLKSESESEDGDDVVARMRPSSTQRLAEITATADARPVVEMPPLARPPAATAPEMRRVEVRPMQRFPAIPREHVQKRPDTWTLVATCLLIVAAFATAALLISR